MTRMTSDIEALQQLFQEGLVQFAVQGLTMVVVTVVLFSLQRRRWRSITLLVVVPAACWSLSLWFRRASDRGYNAVRDGIAGVLTDLPRACPASASSPRTTASATTWSTTATSSASYRDANDYTATRQRHLRRRHRGASASSARR